jgi:hypothetical protein
VMGWDEREGVRVGYKGEDRCRNGYRAGYTSYYEYYRTICLIGNVVRALHRGAV